MASHINTKTARSRLTPRREPYWHKFITGGHIGYRRTDTGGTWLVRYRPKDGKRLYESFGELDGVDPVEQFDYTQKNALDWIASLGIVSDGSYTVKNALEAYVEHLKIHNSITAANKTQSRLNYHISKELQSTKLNKLTLTILTDWFNSLVKISDDPEVVRKSKNTANRVMKMFKAALNLAYRKEIIGTDKAWRNLMAYKNVIVSRSVFLSSEEIQQLLNITQGNFHYLVKSALYTGARYGELINTKVSDFNPIEGTVHLGGKTGIRDCYLNDKAIEHFKILSENKSPSDKLHIKDDGNDWGQGSQRLPMQNAVTGAKLPKDTVFYTLRHTHISIALLAGVNIQVVAENCGTSIIMIEKHYGKFMKTDRRAMFNRVNLG